MTSRPKEPDSRLQKLEIEASVYHVMDDAVVIAAGDGTILSVNKTYSSITGFRPEEVVGRKTSVLNSGTQPESFYERLWETLERSDQWQGELWNRRRNGQRFLAAMTIRNQRDAEGRILRRVAIFRDITEQRRMEQEVLRRASRDALTGLPNRTLLFDRLDQELRKASREGRLVALLFLDLDHFKEVNDRLGHKAGDELLRQAASRISQCVRKSDTVARLGGDEFAVLMGDLRDRDRVRVVADEIVRVLSEPFALGRHHSAGVTTSLGVAMFPDDSIVASDLLERADHAMYAAKRSGRNCWQFFTRQLSTAIEEREQLMGSLRRATADGQLRLYVQPIVDMRSGHHAMLESLIRWEHPEKGLLLPQHFLPLAEDIGVMHDIGDWVFGQVARLSDRLPRSNGTANLRIGVNQSMRELLRSGGEMSWPEQISRLGLPPERVMLEITEESMLSGGETLRSALRSRSDQNVALALDNFGSGYSSMTGLELLDFDFVKIDGSIVRRLPSDPHAQGFIEATVVLARKLGMKVIAEGVENGEQHDYLKALRCDYAQGFFIGNPGPAEHYEPQ